MYLLDTHTLLWFLHNSPQLSKKALKIITTEQQMYVRLSYYNKRRHYSKIPLCSDLSVKG